MGNVQIPFTKFLLSYVIGYYSEDGSSSFNTNANILNVEYRDTAVRFGVLDKDLASLLSTIDAFTFSPVLITEKNGEPSIGLVGGSSPEDVHLVVADRISAPYLRELPLVLECQLSSQAKCDLKQFSLYCEIEAEVLHINAAKSVLTESGEVDLHSLLSSITFGKI